MNNVFKSAERRNNIRGYYNQILSFFPNTQRYADTSFGKTFLLEAGNTDNPAMVLCLARAATARHGLETWRLWQSDSTYLRRIYPVRQATAAQ